MQKPAYTSQAKLKHDMQKNINSNKWNASVANRYQDGSQDIVSNWLKPLQAILCNIVWKQQLSFQLLLVWGTAFDEIHVKGTATPSMKGSATPTGPGSCLCIHII